MRLWAHGSLPACGSPYLYKEVRAALTLIHYMAATAKIFDVPLPRPSDGVQLVCGTDGPDAASSRGRCDARLRYGRRVKAGCEKREKERGYASFAMPSTYRICPVIWEAASEAKNRTAAA